jgi:flagellar protein FliO/FliZ
MNAIHVAQAIAALIFVLGLIGLIGWAYRRFGGQFGGRGAASPKERRLAIKESLALDNRHRLVLVSRDGVEHLLVVGLERTVVVEGRIGHSAALLGARGDVK